MRTIELLHWIIRSTDYSFNIDKKIYKIIEFDFLFFAEEHNAYCNKLHSFWVYP